LSGGGPVEFVPVKLNELEQRRTDLNRRLDAKTAERQELLSRETRYRLSKEEIGRLVRQIQGQPSADLFKLRAQIASQLRALVLTLSIGSIGIKPRLEASIERLRGLPGKEGAIAHMSRARHTRIDPGATSPSDFAAATLGVVYPTADDPLKFEQPITASDASGFEALWPEVT
jgi:hypothetical protein